MLLLSVLTALCPLFPDGVLLLPLTYLYKAVPSRTARFPGSGNKPLKQEGTWLRTLWKDTRDHT